MTSTRLPHLNLLLTFKTVADHRSFSRAAEMLHLTQSAVSQQVGKLEEMIGASLFVRSTRSIDLTEDGLQLLAEIASPLTALMQSFEKFTRPNRIPVLHFECEPVLSAVWLAPRLKRFVTAHGETFFQQRLTTQHLDFYADTQLAIKWGGPSRPGYKSDFLMGLHYAPMCSPRLVSESTKLDTPENLKYFPLLHDRDKQDWHDWLACFRIPDVNPDEGHVANDANVLMHMAIEGHGVALMAVELCAKALQEGALVMPFGEMRMRHNLAYYIFTRISPTPSQHALLFIDWLKEQVPTA